MSDCIETKRLNRSQLLVKLARTSNSVDNMPEWSVSPLQNLSEQNICYTYENTQKDSPSNRPGLLDQQSIAPIVQSSENTLLQLNTDTRTCHQITSEPGCSGVSVSNLLSGQRGLENKPCLSASSSDETDSDFSSDDDCRDPNFKASSSSESLVDTPASSPIQDVTQSNKNEKRNSKKRQISKENWTRKKAYDGRRFGKAYISSSKTKRLIEARKMGPVCSCRLGCSSKIDEERRLQIFTNYWNYGSIDKQRCFIASSMLDVKPKYRYIRVENEFTANSIYRKQRKNNNAFYFTIENSRIRVCKKFFTSTLGINDRPIRTVQAKRNKSVTNIVQSDLRGKHSPINKTDEFILKGIMDHIESIPRIPSHYCRSKSNMEYIDGGLTVTAIHRNYVEQCKDKQIPYAKYNVFQRVFVNNFNISFHRPKKDQCEDCIAFDNSIDKESLKVKYDEHLAEKELSREEKEKDKKSANETNIVAVYDLQAVLQCPRGDSSVFYYVSKINVFNFTICELKNKNVDCYVWHEGLAGRGANEIGSCVFMYLKKLQENSTGLFNVIFYSDNCCGQQKNKFLIALYAYAVQILPNLNSITHKYLIKGHTQNEGDSVHSVIERGIKSALNSGPIFTPDQYVMIIRTAKKTGTPFQVHELDETKFYDLKALSAEMGSNYNKDDQRKQIKMTDIRIMRFEKNDPGVLFVKLSFAENIFHRIQIRANNTRSFEGISNLCLHTLQTSESGVSLKKKEGLLKLIDKNQIPTFYQNFYSKLKVSKEIL